MRALSPVVTALVLALAKTLNVTVGEPIATDLFRFRWRLVYELESHRSVSISCQRMLPRLESEYLLW